MRTVTMCTQFATVAQTPLQQYPVYTPPLSDLDTTNCDYINVVSVERSKGIKCINSISNLLATNSFGRLLCGLWETVVHSSLHAADRCVYYAIYGTLYRDLPSVIVATCHVQAIPKTLYLYN